MRVGERDARREAARADGGRVGRLVAPRPGLLVRLGVVVSLKGGSVDGRWQVGGEVLFPARSTGSRSCRRQVGLGRPCLSQGLVCRSSVRVIVPRSLLLREREGVMGGCWIMLLPIRVADRGGVG